MTTVEKIARELERWLEETEFVDEQTEARRILSLLAPEFREAYMLAWQESTMVPYATMAEQRARTHWPDKE